MSALLLEWMTTTHLSAQTRGRSGTNGFVHILSPYGHFPPAVSFPVQKYIQIDNETIKALTVVLTFFKTETV
jgi:hypothetical protein